MLDVNQIYHMDALAFLREIPSASVDAVITDPPYGMKIADWDQPMDANQCCAEFFRVLGDNAFFAFFMTMPYALAWHNAAAQAGFVFYEHVVWLKRLIGTAPHGLARTHESLWVYKKGSPSLYNTKAPYADIRIPHYLDGALSVEGLDRYIKALHSKANGKTQDMRERGDALNEATNGRFKASSIRSRCPEYANYTNVWSFLPHNAANRYKRGERHPTVKPIPLMERAIILLTPPGALVCDPFMGSGTTAVAALNTERRYIGSENNADYHAASVARLVRAQQRGVQMSMLDDEEDGSDG